MFTDNVKDIKEIWKYGFVYVGDYVNEETVGYIIKYMTKMDEKHKGYQQAMFPSPGIGAGYMKRTDWKKNKYKKGETIETYKSGNGANIPMPIYYRNKIYSEKEKEELWIEKLDKPLCVS